LVEKKALGAGEGSQFNSYSEEKKLENYVSDVWSQNQFYVVPLTILVMVKSLLFHF